MPHREVLMRTGTFKITKDRLPVTLGRTEIPA